MRCEGCVRRKNQWRCLHNAGLIYRRCCRFMRIIYLEIKMHIRTARILFTAMISIFVRVIAGGLIEKVNVRELAAAIVQVQLNPRAEQQVTTHHDYA